MRYPLQGFFFSKATDALCRSDICSPPRQTAATAHLPIMSSTFQSPFYPQYSYQEPQVLVNPNVFLDHGPDTQRSKTPTSLINHTGHSPGPLSTPPLSRRASQGPEPFPDQAPEQMVYDDGFGSLSNSPTSVKTPDHDTFEMEMDMVDSHSMRDFYHNGSNNHQNVIMTTTQASHAPILALDTDMYTFNQQGMPEMPCT